MPAAAALAAAGARQGRSRGAALLAWVWTTTSAALLPGPGGRATAALGAPLSAVYGLPDNGFARVFASVAVVAMLAVTVRRLASNTMVVGW